MFRIKIDSELYSCDAKVKEKRVLPFLRAFRKQYPKLIMHFSFIGSGAWWDHKVRRDVLKEGGCKVIITKLA